MAIKRLTLSVKLCRLKLWAEIFVTSRKIRHFHPTKFLYPKKSNNNENH